MCNRFEFDPRFVSRVNLNLLQNRIFRFDSGCYRNVILRFHWLIACERRYCCVHVCCRLYLNLVYAQPLQKTVAKLRVLLTLNSSDIAVICASTDVNKMNS